MAENDRMSPAELGAMLLERHLAIITTHGADGYPHSTPVWYMPEDAYIGIIANPNSIKARNIRRDARVSVVIATAAAPHSYVMYRGTAQIHTEDLDRYPIEMAKRYLGEAGGSKYIAKITPHPPFVVIKVPTANAVQWIDRDPQMPE
jgi:PPOX class probable F420-dependent enzyme